MLGSVPESTTRYVSRDQGRRELILVRNGAIETGLGLSLLPRGAKFQVQVDELMIQIPAFLFATLSFCFYFTYHRVGASNIAPSSYVSFAFMRFNLTR